MPAVHTRTVQLSRYQVTHLGFVFRRLIKFDGADLARLIMLLALHLAFLLLRYLMSQQACSPRSQVSPKSDVAIKIHHSALSEAEGRE